jgi:hypothetical protein
MLVPTNSPIAVYRAVIAERRRTARSDSCDRLVREELTLGHLSLRWNRESLRRNLQALRFCGECPHAIYGPTNPIRGRENQHARG